MELPVSIQCPHCDGKLKIKDEALIGRSVKCPKCGEKFTAEVPAEPEVEMDDWEQELPMPRLPTRRAKPKAPQDELTSNGADSQDKKKAKKKKKSNPASKGESSNKRMLLIVGGSAALLLMLVAG